MTTTMRRFLYRWGSFGALFSAGIVTYSAITGHAISRITLGLSAGWMITAACYLWGEK